jgi:hypothetical protein
MQSLLKRVRWGVFVVVMAGIFGFGAREAVAASRSGALVCENYPMCASTPECDACCQFLGHGSGFCTMAGACLCS